jgi:hypothetical protein
MTVASKHNRLFKSGFFQIECDTGQLLPLVRDLKPSLESGRYGSDLTQSFPLDPETQPETVIGIKDARIHDFFRGIAEQAELGVFSSRHIILHRYHKSKSMNWHHDVFDRSLILALAYLGDTCFTEDDGGVLEIAKCSVNAQGLPIGEPDIIHRALPNPNTVVLINNTDPTILHRVTPMLTSKIRTVLSCQLGYAEIMIR